MTNKIHWSLSDTALPMHSVQPTEDRMVTWVVLGVLIFPAALIPAGLALLGRDITSLSLDDVLLLLASVIVALWLVRAIFDHVYQLVQIEIMPSQVRFIFPKGDRTWTAPLESFLGVAPVLLQDGRKSRFVGIYLVHAEKRIPLFAPVEASLSGSLWTFRAKRWPEYTSEVREEIQDRLNAYARLLNLPVLDPPKLRSLD